MTRIRYAATIFLGAFLLFQIQPLLGRFLVPRYGGGPAVWTTCLLFFQAVLLAGYGYAHWLGQRRSLKLQALTHCALLGVSFLFLPIAGRFSALPPQAGNDPSPEILLELTLGVGLPYLLLAATGPLLQRWFTLSEPGAPWRFYALANLGSLIALVSYPIAIEPAMRLRTQSWVWSVLYLAYALLCGWTAWCNRPVGEAVATGRSPSALRMLYWLGLSATGSIILMATSNQLSQEVAASPLLWIAPLALYLTTYIIAFQTERTCWRTVYAIVAGLLIPAACVLQGAGAQAPLGLQMAGYLGALFAGCMLCHGELARARPAVEHLTGYYLIIAAGGAIGGVFVALAAPRIFTQMTEYPLGLAAACYLAFAAWIREGAMSQWTAKSIAVRVPLIALLIAGFTGLVSAIGVAQESSLERVRSFHGVLRVMDRVDSVGERRELRHGSILHGFQYQHDPAGNWPTSYYGPSSGVGRSFQEMEQANRRVALIGLGVGTLAAWGQNGDVFRFYEINADVAGAARKWFTYLSRSVAKTEIVLGDARVELQREWEAGARHDFDAIVVDAFSSDSIPVHLLTAECGELYRKRLKPGGRLLLHISNRMLNLEPVGRGLARHLGWNATVYVAGEKPVTGESPSTWMLLREGTPTTTAPGAQPAAVLWTDDFASLWRILK